MKHTLFLTMCCLLGFSVQSAEPKAESQSEIFSMEDGSSVVTLRMNHTVMGQFSGRFDTKAENALQGRFTLSTDGKLTSPALVFSLGALASTVSLRDQHMKSVNYLDTEKHPTATLLQFQSEAVGRTVPLLGQLKVKSIVRTLEQAEFTGKRDGPLLKATARFTETLDHFSLSLPMYMGVRVRPDFEVLVEFTAVPLLSEDEVVSPFQ